MGLLGSQVSAENYITFKVFFFIFYGQKEEQQKILNIVASALINYMYSFGSKLAKNWLKMDLLQSECTKTKGSLNAGLGF